MDLSIVIVNYNMKDLVRACIDSIYRAAPKLECEIILVDNASGDGLLDALRTERPGVVLIGNSDNDGFARACNSGARTAKGRLLLFLNPDTEVTPGSLEGMAAFLDGREDAGIAGCRTENMDGAIEPSVYRFPTLLRTVSDALYLGPVIGGYEVKKYDALKGRPRVEVICGACLMIKKPVFEKLGGFDPELWMYGEDVDLCYRVKRAGLGAYYLEDLVVIHKRGTRHLQEDSLHDMERIAYSHYKWIFHYYGKHCSRPAQAVLRWILFLNVYPKLASRRKKLADGNDSRDNVARVKALGRVLDEFVYRRKAA
jgi:GT2 family glycosyltransferase